MKIKSLKISNLFSFGNAEIELTDKGDRILVIGRNDDDPGLSSNGSGKSSFLEAICWILYKSTARDAYKNEVRRKESNVLTKSSWGKLVLIDEGGTEIKIERSIGDRNFLKLFVGKEDLTMKNDTLTQQKIEDLVEMDFRTFIALNYFSKEEINILCSGSSAERMKFLEKLLDLSVFEICLEKVKRDLKFLETEESKIIEKREFMKGRIIELGDAAGELKEKDKELSVLQRRKTGLDLKYEELTKSKSLMSEMGYLKNMESELDDLSREIESVEEGRKSLEKQIKVLSSKTGEDLIEDLAQSLSLVNEGILDKNSKASALSVRIQQKKEAILKLDKAVKLKGGKCPLCLTVLAGDTLKHIRLEMKKCRDGIITLSQDRDLLVELISHEEHARSKLDDQLHDSRTRNSKLEIAKRDLKISRSCLKSLKENHFKKSKILKEKLKKFPKKMKTFDESEYHIVRRSSSEVQDSISEVNSSILYLEDKINETKGYKEEVRIFDDRLKKFEKKKGVFAFWKQGFGKYGIPKKLVDGFLPLFEKSVNDVLSKLEFNISIQLDTKIKKQSAKDGYSAGFDIGVIDLRDFTFRKFNTFSEGERKRIVVAMMVSLREIFMANKSGLNFMMFDEVLDSLDGIGREKFIKLLKMVEGQKFIISHNSDMEELLPEKILVCKKNGVSYIEEN